MRKIGIIAVLSLMALALAAVPALAAAPTTGNAHFIKSATSASVQNNNLVVNFPKAANKETVSSDLSNTQNFPVDKNGNLVGTISLAPPGPGDFSCPSGQTLVGPTNVSYTNIVLTDATSGATIALR